MAVPANTFQTYTAIGNREDLSNIIYKITPDMTPFTRNIKKGTAKATYHEWQTQALRAPVATNYQVQGDDATATAPVVTTRIGNYTQILRESWSVSETQEAVDAAGRASEIAYQKINKGTNLLNDLEMSLLANNASVAGDASTPAEMAGALAWMQSNVSRGAGGASGTFGGGIQAAATNGTQRTFTESLLKTVMASAFTNGASGPRLAFMSAAHKQIFSSFSGIADIRRDAPGQGQATIVGAADVYISDFGVITTVPVQFGLTRDVLIANPNYWELSYLRPLKSVALAKTGDSEKGMLIMEATLSALNERASAVIADLS